MGSQVTVQVSDKFRPLYNLPADVDMVICIGGRGGMKTYEVSKFAAVKATIHKQRIAITRDEKESIRESILNEVFARYDTANTYGQLDEFYDKLQYGIRDKQTGELLVFTKGFRASSNQKTANLKGGSEIDIAVIEEAEDIRDFNKFATFKDSIRTKNRLIIILLNTPDIEHWIVKRYFKIEPIAFEDVPELKHLTQNDIDGYWKLTPKNVEGFYCIQTNYTENEYLPRSVIKDYEAYGNPLHPTYDLHYYLTAIKGFASSGRKGQVIRKAKYISLAEYLALPYREIYGLDFGTARPAGIVGVKMHNNSLYARELSYKPMPGIEIGKFFALLGLTTNDLVIADSAEPLTIADLRRGWPVNLLNAEDLQQFPTGIPGLNIRGAMKGPNSIETGLQKLIGMELFFVEESENLWTETRNYIYAQNKSGEYTNTPIDDFNHLIDPIRYVATARGRYF